MSGTVPDVTLRNGVRSPRTVQWHLRKAFIKLGISSRGALHAALPP